MGIWSYSSSEYSFGCVCVERFMSVWVVSVGVEGGSFGCVESDDSSVEVVVATDVELSVYIRDLFGVIASCEVVSIVFSFGGWASLGSTDWSTAMVDWAMVTDHKLNETAFDMFEGAFVGTSC